MVFSISTGSGFACAYRPTGSGLGEEFNATSTSSPMLLSDPLLRDFEEDTRDERYDADASFIARA